MTAIAGAMLAGFSVVLLYLFFNAASTNYVTLVYVNAFGEFWFEVVILCAMVVFGLIVMHGALLRVPVGDLAPTRDRKKGK